jgi:hypothetical protein
VASGRYQQAEFAADLWQVHLGEGTDEYRDPVEFFRRTYLTESLKRAAGRRGARLCRARAATRWCSCRPTSAAARRTRCWRSTTCSRASKPDELPGSTPCCRRRARQACRRRGAWCWWATRSRPATRRHQARRHRGAHAVGRAGLAARRQEGLRPHQGRRREGHQPRRRAARAVQRVRPLPDPDRRVGGLRAPAPRPERPAGRQLRDAVHLRPGADRVGQAGEELPAGDHLPASDTAGSPHTRPTTSRWAGSAGARRWTGCATWSGAWSRPGGRPAPRKASRSCAAAVRAAGRPEPVQGPRRDRARLRRLYRTQQRRSSRPSAATPTTRSASRPPTRSTRDLRPALHRLVDAGEVPAHARRAAPDGGGDPQPVGEGRPQPADPAGQRSRSTTRACSSS